MPEESNNMSMAIPLILGGKAALDTYAGFRARRDAKKARSRQIQQDAHQHLGNMLSSAGSGAGGFMSQREAPVPSAMQTLTSSLDPLVRDLLPYLMQNQKKEGTTSNPAVDVNQLASLLSILQKTGG